MVRGLGPDALSGLINSMLLGNSYSNISNLCNMPQMLYLPYCPEHLSPSHFQTLSSKYYQIHGDPSCQRFYHGTNDMLHKQLFPVHGLQFVLMVLKTII